MRQIFIYTCISETLGCWWHSAAASAPSTASIARRDPDLVGADAVLSAELARRTPRYLNLSSLATSAEELDFLQFDLMPEDSPNTRRMLNPMPPGPGAGAPNETRRSSYPEEPSEEQVGRMAIKMMEQACYSVQYRLKDLAPPLLKHSEDPRFRIGYVLRQLEEWENEMLAAYSFVMHKDRKETKKFRIYQHIVYYSHLVRKTLDVTYTVEHVVELHERWLTAVQDMVNKD